MVAFGQVESVWPAVGSVLVHSNVLYANAGRTFGSDGGIALCAYEPQSGRQLWAKNVVAVPPRVNDMLAMSDGKIVLQTTRIDPATGRIDIPKDLKCDSMDGTMDGTWTRLGTRRSGNLNFGRAKAEMLAWNDRTVCGYEGPSRTLYALEREKTIIKGKPDPKDVVHTKEYTWRTALPGNHQAEAMVLTANGLLVAGRAWDPKAAKLSGFLWIVSLKDGKKTLEMPLEVPPDYQGLAVTAQRVVLSLQSGRLLCFGQ